MGFAKSLKTGNAGQKLLIDILVKSGLTVETSVGKCLGWDVKTYLDDFSVSFECKSDEYSAKSGNIAIEFWNSASNKPSGITATEADFWITICPTSEVWLISTAALKKYCGENKPFRTIIKGGDFNADFWLYKKSDITSIFVRLDQVEQENIVECLKHNLWKG